VLRQCSGHEGKLKMLGKRGQEFPCVLTLAPILTDFVSHDLVAVCVRGVGPTSGVGAAIERSKKPPGGGFGSCVFRGGGQNTAGGRCKRNRKPRMSPQARETISQPLTQRCFAINSCNFTSPNL
jgi:hypothetical protein